VPSELSKYYYEITKRQVALWNAMNMEERRNSYEQVSLERGNFSREVEIVPARFGTITGEWSLPHRQQTDGVILYLHGGAFVVGNGLTHRAICSHLAQFSGAQVLAINYSLSPENIFPKALMEIIEIYEHFRKKGISKIGLCGDSAGANLALSAALYLRDNHRQVPDALGLICPWSDLTMSSPSHKTKAALDPYFPNSDRLIMCAGMYAGAEKVTHPLVSPLFADLTSLPPMLVHIGEYEAFLDEAYTLQKHALDAQIPCTLEEYPKMWHVWQHFVGLLPEATESVQKFSAFFKENL
jgi:acetyl esterase/lipase